MIGIFGGGISGFTLAHQLEINGYKDFVIIDDFKENQSSNVAAGLFNPLVFKNINLGWLGAEMSYAAEKFYKKTESKLGGRFYFEKPLFRIFSSIEVQNNWEIAGKNTNLKPFIKAGISQLDSEIYKNPFGSGQITRAGHLDVNQYLNLSRDYFLKTNRFVHGQINFRNITWNQMNVALKMNGHGLLNFRKIVSCLGVQEASAPLFDFLPFALVKGEGITIKSDFLSEEIIVNKQCFVLPIGNKCFKIGSTYNWDDLDTLKSEEAKIEMTNKLQEITDKPFKVIESWAGIRPATRDRRPFLGKHPNTENLYVFGGMGSKAVLLSPYLAEIKTKALLNNGEIPIEMNIIRCQKRWKQIRKL